MIIYLYSIWIDFRPYFQPYFYLSAPFEAPNSDKMPRVNVKTKTLLQKFMVKYLVRLNCCDFKLYKEKVRTWRSFGSDFFSQFFWFSILLLFAGIVLVDIRTWGSLLQQPGICVVGLVYLLCRISRTRFWTVIWHINF